MSETEQFIALSDSPFLWSSGLVGKWSWLTKFGHDMSIDFLRHDVSHASSVQNDPNRERAPDLQVARLNETK